MSTSFTLNTETGEEMSTSLEQARTTHFAAEDGIAPSQHHQNRVYRNGDGGPSQSSHVSVSQNDLRTGGGVLATAQTDFGRPIPLAEVNAKTVVSVDGVTMTVDGAVACGFLAVDPATGRYIDLPAQTQNGAQPGEQQEQEEAPEPGSVAEQQQFLEDLNSADAGLSADVWSSGIEAAVAGGEHSVDLARVAQALDMTEQQASEHVFAVRESYQQAADAAVKSVGVHDVAAFYDHVRTKNASELRGAVSRLLEGDASSFEQMARNFVAQGNDAGIDTQEILEADLPNGVTAARHADGLVYVTVPGVGTLEARAAIRHGVIRVSR